MMASSKTGVGEGGEFSSMVADGVAAVSEEMDTSPGRERAEAKVTVVSRTVSRGSEVQLVPDGDEAQICVGKW